MEILNPEWKKRQKRRATIGLLGILGFQALSVNTTGFNPIGEVVEAVSDSSSNRGDSLAYTGEVRAANEIWTLNPNYVEKLRGLDRNSQQTDYMIFVVEGVARVMKEGYKINPRVMASIAPIENGYGADVVAKANNFFGMKAYGDDPAIRNVPTHEDFGNGREPWTDDFRSYDDPMDSFRDHARMVSSLEHYQDAIHCISDDAAYVRGLEHELYVGSCTDIANAHKLAYATGNKNGEYEALVLNVIDYWGLQDIFVKQ